METVKRDGPTYVINISFTSRNPDRSAQIANAIADAYIMDQMQAKYLLTKRAGTWLQARIGEIRGQVTAADQAVLDFKNQNNMVDSGAGRSMSEQQLAEVNSQLILARAQTAEAKARLDRIQEILKANGSIPDAGVADMLRNDVISKLRSQYLEIHSREAVWTAQYGKDHLAAVNLRKQMDEIYNSIFSELRRIAGAYQSDFDIARAREQSLAASLNKVVTESQIKGQAEIQLRQLQSNSQTYRSLYDSFLQRYTETVQQQSFPISEARLISPALAPTQKSYPNTILSLGMALVAGVLLSVGAAVARESHDTAFRTGSQVEEALQVPCIALVPKIASAGSSAERITKSSDRIVRHGGLLAYATDQPLSRFCESLREVKVAFDMVRSTPIEGAKPNNVIGFTSTLPEEGKSTLAANFARLLGLTGLRVVLVDADLRNPKLTFRLSPEAKLGLREISERQCTLQDALYSDPATGVRFVPARLSPEHASHTSDLLGGERMQKLFDKLRREYDVVVVDLPPIAPVVDVRVTSNFVNHYVFVVEWGRTGIDVVRHHLGRLASVHDRLLGVVLNKANIKRLKQYQHYYGKSYYGPQ